MAVKRPRVTFTPDEDTLHALGRISGSSGKPPSAIVAECMAMMTPHLVNLAEVLEHANALTAESKAVMIIAADQAADQLKPAMLEARRIVGELTRQIDDAISGNEPPLPLGLATPPPSNTGVTVHIRGDAKAA